MNWQTIFIIISLVSLGLFTFGVDSKWEMSMLGVGLFFFVATFVKVERTP